MVVNSITLKNQYKQGLYLCLCERSSWCEHLVITVKFLKSGNTPYYQYFFRESI